MKYLTSAPDVISIAETEHIKQQIEELNSRGYIPVFSQEDWGIRSESFIELDFFKKINCKVHVIAYVRPQVGWFNSGWWQWWAWEDDFDVPRDVLNLWGPSIMMWGWHMTSWSEVPGVKKTTTRLHTHDIVSDFMNIFGVKHKPETVENKNNVSLSPTLIKLLFKYKKIRKVYGSSTDFVLSDIFSLPGKAPWIIDKKLTQEILKLIRADNLKLMELLDSDSKEVMKNDSKWWDIKAYKNRKIWKEKDFTLSEDELEELLKQSIHRLLNLE